MLKLAELRARAASVGALSEAALFERLGALEAQFDITTVSAVIADRLAEIRSRIEVLRMANSRDRGNVERLRRASTRFHAAERDLVSYQDRKRTADQLLGEAKGKVEAAERAMLDADTAAREVAGAVSQSEAEQEKLRRVRAAILERARLTAEVASAQEAETALVEDRESRRKALEEAERNLAASEAKQTRLAEIDMAHAALQRWADRASALAGLEATWVARQAVAESAVRAADHARSALVGLRAELQVAVEAERNGAERLASHQREASELARLLSQLMEHIGHNDTDYPVCSSTFEPGHLLERARGAISAQDLRLANETAAQEALRVMQSVAARKLGDAESAIIAGETAVVEAEAARNVAVLEREAIATALILDLNADVAAVITSRLALLMEEKSRELASETSLDVSSAQSMVDRLLASVASISENKAAAGHRRVRAEESLAQITELLNAETRPWSLEGIDDRITAQSHVLIGLREREIAARAAASAARVEEDAARHRVVLAEAEVKRVMDAITAALDTMKESVAWWAEEGMAGSPSEVAITAREAELDARSNAIAEGMAKSLTLAHAHEALLEQEDLRELAAAMEAEGGAGAPDNPAAYEQQLLTTVESLRSSLKLTSDTRAAVVDYADHLKSEAEGFSSQFLMPLNDLIDAFNRALLSTPGESVQFKSAHTVERTSLAMRLRYADPIDNAQYLTDLPPQLVLSEGQMAANGFSILCAASTAYRWSRWRALLLDDPLQHNDIIHAAAFFDVMRNLVETEGYQLLMSSHKRDEGEFIARKFDAAGLPCTVVELTGVSKDGVRMAPPRHNAAARRMLNGPAARFGTLPM